VTTRKKKNPYADKRENIQTIAEDTRLPFYFGSLWMISSDLFNSD
jgi:hypothetical protein